MEKLRSHLTPQLFIALALLVTAYGALTGYYLVYIALVFSLLGFMSGEWSKRTPTRAARFVGASLLAYYAWEGIRGLFGPDLLDTEYNLYFDTLIGRDSPFLILGFVVLFMERLLGDMTVDTLAKHARLALVVAFVIMVGGVWLGYFPVRAKFLADSTMKIAYMTAVTGYVAFLDWPRAKLSTRLFSIVALLMAFLIQTEVTLSRGSLLAMMVMLPVLVIFVIWSAPLKTATKLLTFLAFGIVGVIALGTLWVIIADGEMGQRIARIGEVLQNPAQAKDIDWSLAQRLDMWQASIQAIKAQPIFGYSTQLRFEAIVPYLNYDIHYDHVHNTIMSNWLAGGVLGVILYFNVVALPFSALILLKHKSTTFIYFACVLSGILFVTGLTDESFFSDLRAAFWVFYIVLFVALAVIDKRQSEA